MCKQILPTSTIINIIMKNSEENMHVDIGA